MCDLTELDEEFQKIHEKLNEPLQLKKIYHYTSMEGLEGIIKTRKLRFTDYRYFNDPTELQYGIHLILSQLSQAGISPDPIDMTIDFFKNLREQFHIYVACFSTEIKKLSLWRYYAFAGTGYAIAFNKSFYESKASEGQVGDGVISKVIYGYEASFDVIKEFIDVYLDSNVKGSDAYKRLLANLIAILPSLKHDSFKDESEVRIFYPEGPLIRKSENHPPFYFDDQ